MKALLLAAGNGVRLKPVTDYVPKCLVPIHGKPLLEYWLDSLVNAGISDVLINMHYKADLMEAFIANSQYKKFVTLVYEKDLLLTGGTLYKNRDFFKDDDILMAHADNLCLCDFKAFIDTYSARPSGVDITMMTFTTDRPKTCGIVEVEDGIVIAFHEKIENPPSNLANGAVYILSAKVWEFLDSLHKEKIDFSTEVLSHFVGRMNTFHNDVYHRDIGNLESYALAQIEMINSN